jgi:hypothetical protein
MGRGACHPGHLRTCLFALGSVLAAAAGPLLAAEHSTHNHIPLAGTGLAAAFLFGLLGNTHCFGMCGPLVSLYTSRLVGGGGPSPPRQHLLFNLGRSLAYNNLGVLFGAAGFILGVRPWTVGLVGLAAGLFVLAMGSHFLGVGWSCEFAGAAPGPPHGRGGGDLATLRPPGAVARASCCWGPCTACSHALSCT